MSTAIGPGTRVRCIKTQAFDPLELVTITVGDIYTVEDLHRGCPACGSFNGAYILVERPLPFTIRECSNCHLPVQTLGCWHQKLFVPVDEGDIEIFHELVKPENFTLENVFDTV